MPCPPGPALLPHPPTPSPILPRPVPSRPAPSFAHFSSFIICQFPTVSLIHPFTHSSFASPRAEDVQDIKTMLVTTDAATVDISKARYPDINSVAGAFKAISKS